MQLTLLQLDERAPPNGRGFQRLELAKQHIELICNICTSERTAHMSIDYTGNRYGNVSVDGKLIHLTENAYADNYGTDGEVRYYAHGRDDQGNEYLVSWETTAAWDAQEEAARADPDNFVPTLEEESACDWGAPIKAKLL
jgi:hypothetical protein